MAASKSSVSKKHGQKESRLKQTAPAESNYDVIIVGGGMVGISLAFALQQGSEELALKVLIIEAAPINFSEKPYQPSFDARSTVLSHGSVEYFKKLGIWDSLAGHATSIKKIHVSDQGKFGSVRMNSDEHGVEALGYVVENIPLGKALNTKLLESQKIEICDSAKVKKIFPNTELLSVELLKDNCNKKLTTKLVVLAEGGRSGLCEDLGIYREIKQYAQTAIITNISIEEPHANIAYERFTPKGPLALLPLSKLEGENRCALVWTHPEESVDEVLALSDEEFLSKLVLDFGSKLGKFTRVGERNSYPLNLIQAEEQFRHGIVLLGNVAHTLHPVAGQGFNLALRDAMCLAEHILAALKHNENPGSVKILQKYQDQRLKDQEKIIAFSHYMTQLFSSNNNALAWVRKFGLLSIDLIPGLKKSFGKQAMGEGGRMAKVARMNP